MSQNILQVHSIHGAKYQSVWDFQEILLQKVIHSKRASEVERTHHVIFCEHRPVYTLGKSGSIDNLKASLMELEQENFEFHKINRGGDITYHGPGQWTIYVIIDLESYYRDVHKYVRSLEQIVIDVLAEYAIDGFRLDDFTGVWTGEGELKRKICALGVHLSRWVSMHGLGFNIEPNLEHFRNIVPCGIATPDKTITSVTQETRIPVSMEAIKESFLKHFQNHFPMDLVVNTEY